MVAAAESNGGDLIGNEAKRLFWVSGSSPAVKKEFNNIIGKVVCGEPDPYWRDWRGGL